MTNIECSIVPAGLAVAFLSELAVSSLRDSQYRLRLVSSSNSGETQSSLNAKLYLTKFVDIFSLRVPTNVGTILQVRHNMWWMILRFLRVCLENYREAKRSCLYFIIWNLSFGI